MALQVWMPLNGKIENCGLAGNDFTVSGTTAFVDGITGKALNTGAVTMSAAMTGNVLNNQHFTYCCWIYVNADTGSSSDRAMIFGNDNNGVSTNNRKFSIYQYPTCNDLHLSWMNNTVNETFLHVILTGVLPSKKWTHVVVVYDNPTARVYINGVEQWSDSGVSNSSSFAYVTTLIHDSQYHYLADVRIYDNALSPKEIHEISLGLCCHYPLNDPTPTASVNKYNGNTFEGEASSSSYTITKLTDERGYNFTLKYTGTGSNTWPNIGFPYISFTVGKTYDYSCKVRANSGNFALFFRASRMDNDWVTKMVNVMNCDGKWHEYHLQLTLQAESERAGNVYPTRPCIQFYSETLSTKDKVYTCDFDLKDVQISECDTDASISNGAWSDLTVYDTSGFGNHGSVTAATAPVLAGDSPRYDRCYEFERKHYLIGKMPFNGQPAQTFTINVWINQIDGGGYSTWLDSNGHGGSGLWLAINTENWAEWAYRGSVSPYYAQNKNSALAKNTWHMFTYVFNSGTVTWYLDGVKGTSTKYADTALAAGANFTLGDSYTGSSWDTNFHGKMSDFRMYATALSDADVAALYNAPVSIASDGAMIVKGEVIEA